MQSYAPFYFPLVIFKSLNYYCFINKKNVIHSRHYYSKHYKGKNEIRPRNRLHRP